MNVINKYFIILLTGVLTLQSVYAQNGGLRVFDLPSKYLLMNEYTSTSITNEYINGKVWVVYSDRTGNKTYTSPKNRGNIIESNIDFLESFYVIDEIEDYLHIVKDENLRANFTLSKTSKDFGWISKDNLLLTSHCLTTFPNKNNQIVIPISINNNSIQESDLHFNNIYFDPYLVNHRNMSIPQDNICLYFVYKEANNSLLVGKSGTISTKDATEIILGWIPRQDITTWNIPTALEVNWDKQAIESRLKLSINPRIFSTKSKAVGFSKGKGKKKGFWENNDNETIDYGRKSGKFYRYPIIEELNGTCKIVYIDDENPSSVTARYGYAPLSFKSINEPLFRKVILISRIEFSDILSYTETIYKGISNKGREGLLNAYLELLYEKTDIQNNYYWLGRTYGEVSKTLFGVNTDNSYSKIQLGQLLNKSVLSNNDIKEYRISLYSKIQFLEEVFNSDNYRYSVKIWDEIYYWLPVDKLP